MEFTVYGILDHIQADHQMYQMSLEKLVANS